MTEQEFQTKVLGSTEALSTKITELEKLQKTTGEDSVLVKQVANELKVELNKLRTEQLNLKRGIAQAGKRKGEVTEDCARALGAIALVGAIGRGTARDNDRACGVVKDVLGIEAKTALSSTDIPLPVGYSGEVVELVAEYGAARKFGTVYPLGSGVVNLPRLKTDTTFTVLAQATAITEKSPQTEWVTFTPEKFGGLIRLPAEIDADSIVPMGQFLARYSARNIARVEDWNFFMGTGTVGTVNGDVEGLCVSTVSNSKTVASGTLASPSEFTLAHLRSVRAKCDAAALQNAAYYMHPSFEQLLSNLNTAGDKPYNANGIMGATLDGYPIRWVDVMLPYLTTDVVSKVHVLFGDASYQYLGVRGGISFATSTEAGFATDEVLVRCMERFTIGLMATGAVGGLITHSS
jgi:HK97 family phage major capsid protein